MSVNSHYLPAPRRHLLRFLYRRAKTIGLSTQSARWLYSDLLDFFIRNEKMSLEYICQYLKKCGDGLIWAITGQHKPDWVRMGVNHKSRQIPTLLRALRGYSDAVLLRFAKVARAIRLDAVTKSQAQKVVKGITAPFNGNYLDLEGAAQYICAGLTNYNLRVPSFRANPLEITRIFSKTMSSSGKVDNSVPPIRESLGICRKLESLGYLPDFWVKIFYPIREDFLKSFQFDQSELDTFNTVGEIHAAQEGGGKLRLFASPHTCYQALLSPLHNVFDYIARQLPSNFIPDQTAGKDLVQTWLSQGKVVYSVDQTTATCRFHLNLLIQLAMSIQAMQDKLGLEVIPTELILLFWFVSRGEWKVGDELVSTGLFPSTLKWVVGQPLGTIPSMSGYNLAHNLLCLGICSWQQKDPTGLWAIVGDDFCTCDEELYNEYKAVLTGIGCEINDSKSYISDQYAEFVGYSIQRDSSIRPGQWKEICISNLKPYTLEFKGLSKQEAKDLCPRLCFAHDLFLFMEGITDSGSLTDATYSDLLKASSLLNERSSKLFTYKPWPTHAVLMQDGLQRELKRQFPERPYGVPLQMSLPLYNITVNLLRDVTNQLRQLPGYDSGYDLQLTQLVYYYKELWSTGIHKLENAPSWVYAREFISSIAMLHDLLRQLCCPNELGDCLPPGSIDLIDELFERAVYQTLWLPPVKRTTHFPKDHSADVRKVFDILRLREPDLKLRRFTKV